MYANPGAALRRSALSALARPACALGAALLLVAVGGCTTTSAGRPTAAAPSAAASATPPSPSPPSPTPSTVPSTPPTVSPAQLCPGIGTSRQDAAALVTCITSTVAGYWTSALAQPVEEIIIVDPAPDQVPEQCRTFLAFGTAFFCGLDATVYITGAMLNFQVSAFGDAFPYGVAATVAHEIGHVVQDVTDQPLFEDPDFTDEKSRIVEQQADCLVGVWSQHAAVAEQVDAAAFRSVYEQTLVIIGELPIPPELEGYDEVATHGTVQERMVSYDRGATGGAGNPCELV